MKFISTGAVAVVLLAAAGCQTAGATLEPVSLAGGAVMVARPRGFETTVAPSRPGGAETVSFRGPARRRGDFNNCSVRVVAVGPEVLNGKPLGEFVASAARDRHAAHQATDGLHDVSLSEPAPGRATDPYVVRSSFTIDYTLRTSERYWGASSAAGDYVIVQSCGSGGTAEELATVENLTRPLFASP